MAFGTPFSVYHGYSELASISCCFTHIILSAIRDTNTSVASCVPSKTDTTSSFVFANGNTSCPKFQLRFHSNYGLQNLHLLLSRQRLCMEPGKPSAQRLSWMVFSFIQLRFLCYRWRCGQNLSAPLSVTPHLPVTIVVSDQIDLLAKTVAHSVTAKASVRFDHLI